MDFRSRRSAEEALPRFLADDLKMCGNISDDRSQSPDTQRRVARNGDVMLLRNPSCEAQMVRIAASLDRRAARGVSRDRRL
jgi:hypothetical protein